MAGNPLSRRRVLQGSAVAAVGVAGPPLLEGTGSAAAMPPGGGAADLVLHNGQIVTMGPGFHIASAVAVKSGRVVQVGHDQSVRHHIGRRTQVINLRGRTVLPGINDSHVHCLRTGLGMPPYTIDVGPSVADSIAAVADAVGAAVRRAEPGEWIRGKGWNGSVFAPGKQPSRENLDPVSPDNPVALLDWSNHELWVNSKALEIAGIDRDTPDPSGGRIVRDATGEPTGLLFEAAMDLVNRHIPEYTEKQQADAIDGAIDLLLSLGITSITEPGIGTVPQRIYANKARRGALGIRVTALLSRPDGTYSTSTDHVREILETFESFEDVDSRRFNIAGVKLRADGVPISSRTAWMREPYVGGGRGSLRTDGDTDAEKVAELKAMIDLVHRSGLQVGTHATGGAAIDAVAAGYAASVRNPAQGAARRHYVIHGDFTWPDTLRVLARTRCAVNFNPNIKHLIADSQPAVVGAERAAYQVPYRSALRAGVTVTSASDAPNVAPDWRQGLETMLLREGLSGTVSGPDETIGVREALHTYTTGAAWQDHAEHWKGTLERGMAADMCVLDGALLDDHGRLAPNAHDIAGLPVALTLVDGQVAYDASNQRHRAATERVQQASWVRSPDPTQICSHC